MTDQILLIDRDPEHASELRQCLHEYDCEVESLPDLPSALRALGELEIDIVIVVCQSAAWWRKELRQLRGALNSGKSKPEVLCVLRWPARGPSDRLYGDEMKATVLHEA